ncbi:MAG TPA: hypothetical protein VES69_11160 [Pyrinomonadaceae bacterium]|nr:hypothetical protein [Pyrinomonadaceae bacterium]
MNSSNDRRALDGVSPHWDARERNLQTTHTRPVGNLFPDSPKPRPTISTEQNAVGRLTVSLISRKARASLFEKLAGLFRATHIFRRMLGPGTRSRRGIGAEVISLLFHKGK